MVRLKPILKNEQTFLRHEPKVREPDGAVHWQNLRRRMYDSYPNTQSWIFDKWLDALSAASDKVGFEYCLDSHGEPKYIRSIQRHSGAPKFADKFMCLAGKSECVESIHLPNRLFEHLQVDRRGLIAGATSDRRGRQACFLSATNPLDRSRCFADCPPGPCAPRRLDRSLVKIR